MLSIAVATAFTGSCASSPDSTERATDDASTFTDTNQRNDVSFGQDAALSDSLQDAQVDMSEWSWISLPETKCGNGEPTGIGVNINEASSDVLVFFSGGGACWDRETCFVLRSASNIQSGYNASSFENEERLSYFIFDRSSPDNPFRNFSYVLVPYCTGDIFSGDAIRTFNFASIERTVHFHGAKNAQEVASYVGESFPNTSRVFIAGASAGGFGAQINFHHFAGALPQSEHHLLSDSAPLIQPRDGRLQEISSAWNTIVPEGCVNCLNTLPNLMNFLNQRYPQSRKGLISPTNDLIIGGYFSYPSFSNDYRDELLDFVATNYESDDNNQYFIKTSTNHVLLDDAENQRVDGLPLVRWLQGWESGIDWRSVRP